MLMPRAGQTKRKDHILIWFQWKKCMFLITARNLFISEASSSNKGPSYRSRPGFDWDNNSILNIREISEKYQRITVYSISEMRDSEIWNVLDIAAHFYCWCQRWHQRGRNESSSSLKKIWYPVKEDALLCQFSMQYIALFSLSQWYLILLYSWFFHLQVIHCICTHKQFNEPYIIEIHD